MDTKLLKNTLSKAHSLLKENTYTSVRNGKTYRRIIPSKEFYVHQWNWDSATHAMGLVHVDEELAYDEIRSLLSGQWENGLVAQITFNPNEKKYFPGPEFWGTEQFAQGEIITSGITQPPLIAISVAYVYQFASNRRKAEAFLDEVLPKVEKYHEHLDHFRDSEKSGLLTIIHPWESGTDNSPRFDSAMDAIHLDAIPQAVKDLVHTYRTDDKEGESTHRPRLHDYYRYMHLVSLYKKWHWDYEKIVRDSPFAMKDIHTSSIWARANDALASLYEIKGMKDQSSKHRVRAKRTKEALKRSWNDKAELYTDTVIAQGKNISVHEDTIASLMPLYAGAPDAKQLKALLKKLDDPKKYHSSFPIPSTALDNPKFDLARYWRGPTWPITNLFLIDGLSLYKEHEIAARMRTELITKTLSVIADVGFSEYYDPHMGVGEVESRSIALGFGSFSWTAAIFIILASISIEHK